MRCLCGIHKNGKRYATMNQGYVRPKTLKNAWGFISPVIYEETGEKPPKVKLPQIVQNEGPFLEPEQIRPFIEAVQGIDGEIPALLALSSLRRSELLAFTWEKI